MMDENKILDVLETDNRALLYKARWNEKIAGEVVPQIIDLLSSSNRETLRRSLNVLVTIGPSARSALDAVIPYLQSDDDVISRCAALAVSCIALHDSDAAIQPLQNAYREGFEKPILDALICFKSNARSTADIFAQAFANKSAKMRLLALRGLKEIEAPSEILKPILSKAEKDRSLEVQAYARKNF
jgi:hypothetical protein